MKPHPGCLGLWELPGAVGVPRGCPPPSRPLPCPSQCAGGCGDVRAAREKRQHMSAEWWLCSGTCLPSYISSRRLEGIILNAERDAGKKKKKSQKEIFPVLPTLEKYAKVMSLSGVSHRWESGKPAHALAMSSVLINCTLVSFSSSSLWLSIVLYISFKYTLLAITLEQEAVPQVKKWLGLLYICSLIENIYSIKGKNKCGPSALSSINCY